MRGSVTVHMAASADLIWDLVSDVTRVGEFSPETFEAQCTKLGAEEGGDEGFLAGGLDCFGAVAGPYPGDGVGGRVASQNSQVGQRRPGSAVAAKASNFGTLPRPGPLQEVLERLSRGLAVSRNAEVWPVDIAVVPWRLPAAVEVQAVVRLPEAGARA